MAINNTLNTGLLKKPLSTLSVASIGNKPAVATPAVAATPKLSNSGTGTGSTGGIGAYKGVTINSGTTEQIQEQMRNIDAQQSKAATTNAAQAKADRPVATVVTKDDGVNKPTKTTTVKGLFPDVVSSLVKTSTGTNSVTKDAQKAYEDSVEYQRKLKESIAQQGVDIASDPVSARIMQGRAAAVQTANAEKLSAAQGAVQQQQAAIGYGQTQQSMQQSGLTSAAGLVAPQVAGYGQTVFNPAEGGFSGGSSNLDPSTVSASLAQDVITGRKTYEQAVSALSYAGAAGQQFLNDALKKLSPSFNIPQASAQIAGQTAVLGNLPALQSANTAAQGIKNTIVQYINSNPTLNPSDLAAGNAVQQWIQGKQLTDPRYQTLFNYLNEYTSTLAPILGVGGDATNLKTEIAQSFINAKASGKSIVQVLNDIENLATNKLQNIASGATGGGVVAGAESNGGYVDYNW